VRPAMADFPAKRYQPKQSVCGLPSGRYVQSICFIAVFSFYFGKKTFLGYLKVSVMCKSSNMLTELCWVWSGMASLGNGWQNASKRGFHHQRKNQRISFAIFGTGRFV